MAGKTNPAVQEALRLMAADPSMSCYAASKAAGAPLQSVYSAARRADAGASLAELNAAIRLIERDMKVAGLARIKMLKDALASLQRLADHRTRVLAEADAEDAEVSFDRVISDGKPDFIE